MQCRGQKIPKQQTNKQTNKKEKQKQKQSTGAEASFIGKTC